MGISGLLPFLKNASRPVNVKELKGSTAAIDVYCFLHKGAFGCAELLMQGKPTDAYIKYVMKYVDLLLYHDIKPILVFDGRNLPSKAETEKKRRENRRSNREKAVKLLAEGNAKEARDYFQRCVDITPEMARDVINASRERNIDCIVAPYEADAQLAYLSVTGLADFIITEDSDLTLFGCDKIVFKLTPSGDGVLYQKSRLNEVFGSAAAQFDFDKFRKMCIMSGCDYLPSLPGIGLAKAKLFWSKISNPNLNCVLPKIPHYLKNPSLTVTPAYVAGFQQAYNTFLYQIVFDPLTRKERPLTDYQADVDIDTLTYCGKFSDSDTALQLALGNLDLNSLRKANNFDPDRHSLGKHAKFGSIAKHTSIWSKGYSAEKSHRATSTLSVMSSKSKQVFVSTSFPRVQHKSNSSLRAPQTQINESKKTDRVVSEKRKVMNADEVAEMLLTGDDILTRVTATAKAKANENDNPTPSKRMKLDRLELSTSTNQQKEDQTYTRILGDNQLEVKNTTISRYFGGSKIDTAKVAAAGNWFESINTSAITEDRFVYEPDLPKAKRNQHKLKECDSTEEERNDGDQSQSSQQDFLSAFKRPQSRNPFAISRPLFEKNNELNKEKSISDIVSEFKNQEKTKLKDISNTSPKLELVKDFVKDNKKLMIPTINKKEETPESTNDKDDNQEETVHSSLLTTRISSSNSCSDVTAPSQKNRKSTSPIFKKSTGPVLKKSVSLTKKNARPSGLSKQGSRGGSVKLASDPKQPSVLNMFVRQEKRANV